MTPNPLFKYLPALLLALPALAHAHAGHPESGALAGLLHPFTGLDHLLAIVGVGLWGAQRGGSWREAARLPLCFVAAMLAGALLARAGLQLPALEPLLATTLLGIGLALFSRRGGPSGLASLLCMAAGLLHGAAHGQELQGTAALAGMLAATAVGHTAGLLAGRQLGARRPWVWQLLGLALAGAGSTLLLG
jgi:urease accessory protein